LKSEWDLSSVHLASYHGIAPFTPCWFVVNNGILDFWKSLLEILGVEHGIAGRAESCARNFNGTAGFVD
jgi:hypothetical protein